MGVSEGTLSQGPESHFFDWKVRGYFADIVKTTSISEHITLNLLPLSLGDFSFTLTSFTSGRPTSGCRDTKGSVGEREGDAITRSPGTNSGTFWEPRWGISQGA